MQTLPVSFQTILKARNTQVVIKNKEISEENLNYISAKKLERLKTSYQNYLEKSRPSTSQQDNIEDKSVRSFKINPKNPTETLPSSDLRKRIQRKLEKSNEVLQKQLSNKTTSKKFHLSKNQSLPNLAEICPQNKAKPNQKVPSNLINSDKKIENYQTTGQITGPVEGGNLEEENVNQDCFVPDWDSVSEAHWQNLLNSDIFKIYNINPIILIENNPDYFSHLLGLCACFRCICGICKCKYAESKNVSLRLAPNKSQTCYQREYFDKSGDYLNNNGNNPWALYNSNGFDPNVKEVKGFNYTTTNQAEFRPFAVTPVKRKPRAYSDNKYPFLSLSTYNSNFVDWKNYESLKMKMPQSVTVIKDLPFNENTTYKDHYLRLKMDPSNSDFVKTIHKSRQKMGIFNNTPFLSQTHHSMAFKPFTIDKSKDHRIFLRTPSNLEVLHEKVQPGHFMTMTGHDFKGLQEKICPAKRKIDMDSLKSQIYNKLENINQEYQKTKIK